MKNKIGLVRIAKKGEQNNTAQRPCRKHEKQTEKIKLTENANKAVGRQQLFNEERQVTGGNTWLNALKMAKIRSNLYTLGFFKPDFKILALFEHLFDIF